MTFPLALKADEDLLRLIPDCWKDFNSRDDHGPNEHLLLLETMEDADNFLYSAGWNLMEQKGSKRVVYAPHGKAHFAITYNVDLQKVCVSVRQRIDSFIRVGIMYGMLIALSKTSIGMHGATVECGKQTILLSAPSGTGKTTLAELLQNTCGARIINGDFALLSIEDSNVIFNPTPFCGTSGICLNERKKIDRIVFLSQAPENRWKEMSGRQVLSNLANNAFVPSFDKDLRQMIMSNAFELATRVKANEFAFAPTREAASMLYSKIC